MKSALLALMVCVFPAFLRAGVLCVHAVVLCPADRPNVAAAFEQTGGANPAPQSCRFLYLTSDQTPSQMAAWNADIQALQSLTLTSQPAFSTPRGLRQNQVDGQGRIRRIIWTSSQGLTSESALFNADEHILRLDLWLNQTQVPDADLKPMVCGPDKEQVMDIRVFNSETGNIPNEVHELEILADTVTDYVLVHDLDLSTTACSESPPAAPDALAANTVPKATPTPTWIIGQALAVVPNPASGRALIFYRLPTRFQDVKILIYGLTGREMRSYDQGDQDAGAHQLSADLESLARGVYFVMLLGDNGGGPTVLGRFKLAVLN